MAMRNRPSLLTAVALGVFYPCYANQYEPAILCEKEPYHFMVLTKAVDQSFSSTEQYKRWYSEPIRTVVGITDTDKTILNPQGDGYPETSRLHDLSLKQAEMMWGEAKNGANGIKTFDLILMSGPPGSREGYRLDARFVDGKLNSYRLKGPLITDSVDWKKVN